LEALGDELALDTDTSYLEDVSTPKVPTREPGAESVNSVSQLLTFHPIFYSIAKDLQSF